jgi:hypothetical protein
VGGDQRQLAAERDHLDARALDYLVARGELKPRRIGRRILFERRELERFARRDHPIKPASADDGQMGVRPGRSTGRGT